MFRRKSRSAATRRKEEEEEDEQADKDWARQYLLDPLTAPEPHQVDGPGTSFFSPGRSLSLSGRGDTRREIKKTNKGDKPSKTSKSDAGGKANTGCDGYHRRCNSTPSAHFSTEAAIITAAEIKIHHPKPVSPGLRHSYLRPENWASTDILLNNHQQDSPSASHSNPLLVPLLQKNIGLQQQQGLQKKATQRPGDKQNVSNSSRAASPVTQQLPHKLKKSDSLQSGQILDKQQLFKHQSVQTQTQTQTQTQLSRAARPSVPSAIQVDSVPSQLSPTSFRSVRSRTARRPPQTHHTQGTAEILAEIYAERKSLVTSTTIAPSPSPPPTLPPPQTGFASSPAGIFLRQVSSFTSSNQKSGDGKNSKNKNKSTASTTVIMGSSTHSPPNLESHGSAVTVAASLLKTSSPNSSRKHRSRRSRGPLPDGIDTLDKSGFGAAYHHGGPFDATLAAVNRNKKYAPLDAVKDSNMEALRATPREYIVDSLEKHVPLQGTGIIPPGMPDISGNVMTYEEGADLMREADAPGGPYKRWDFVKYHPDDLKGRGEPSFTIERSLKDQEVRLRKHPMHSFSMELQDQTRPLLPVGGAGGQGEGKAGGRRVLAYEVDGSSSSSSRQDLRRTSSISGVGVAGGRSGQWAREAREAQRARGSMGSGSASATPTSRHRSSRSVGGLTDGLRQRLGNLGRK